MVFYFWFLVTFPHTFTGGRVYHLMCTCSSGSVTIHTHTLCIKADRIFNQTNYNSSVGEERHPEGKLCLPTLALGPLKSIVQSYENWRKATQIQRLLCALLWPVCTTLSLIKLLLSTRRTLWADSAGWVECSNNKSWWTMFWRCGIGNAKILTIL